MSITSLMFEFVKVREALEAHGVRNTGDYAEILVAAALNAERNVNGVTKDYDVLCPLRGRIEVRSRTLPRDGRKETRLQIPKEKVNGFDLLAGVLFDPHLAISGGCLLPHDDAISLSVRQKFLRIPFDRGFRHSNAIDISTILREAQLRV